MRKPGTRKLVYDKARRTIVIKSHSQVGWVWWWFKRLFDRSGARRGQGEIMESGWLIEKGTPCEPEYLTVEKGMFVWTKDNDKALRLCRREDADRLAEIVIEDADRICEHQWD